MCGINAVFSKSEIVSADDLEIYKQLFINTEDRGKDASGICWDTGENIRCVKSNISADDLMEHINKEDILTPKTVGRWVFGHSRFATQGDPKDNTNNHPVINANKSVVLVHNGIIRMSKLEDHSYLGEVDTEILVSYIEKYGIEYALSKVEGSAAVIFFFDESKYKKINEKRLFLWRSSSPMLWAETETAYFIASTHSLLVDSLGEKIIPNRLSTNYVQEYGLYIFKENGLTKIREILPEDEKARKKRITSLHQPYRETEWDEDEYSEGRYYVQKALAKPYDSTDTIEHVVERLGPSSGILPGTLDKNPALLETEPFRKYCAICKESPCQNCSLMSTCKKELDGDFAACVLCSCTSILQKSVCLNTISDFPYNLQSKILRLLIPA